jgi:hypothetical protein
MKKIFLLISPSLLTILSQKRKIPSEIDPVTHINNILLLFICAAKVSELILLVSNLKIHIIESFLNIRAIKTLQ